MRLPRFRLQTLTIVVAVAAIESWILATYSILGLLLLGPLIGAALGRLLSRDLLVGYLGGGVTGGVVAAVMCVIFMEIVVDLRFLRSLGLGPDWEDYVFWLVMSSFAGFCVGLTFLSLDAFRSWAIGDSRIVEESATLVTSRARESE